MDKECFCKCAQVQELTAEEFLSDYMASIDDFIYERETLIGEAEEELEDARRKREVVLNILKHVQQRPKMFDDCGSACY